MNRRKIVFFVSFVSLLLCLCSCLACDRGGRRASIADPDVILGTTEPAPPETDGNADDDEAGECPTTVCAP
jgi:hypothetical protein